MDNSSSYLKYARELWHAADAYASHYAHMAKAEHTALKDWMGPYATKMRTIWSPELHRDYKTMIQSLRIEAKLWAMKWAELARQDNLSAYNNIMSTHGPFKLLFLGRPREPIVPTPPKFHPTESFVLYTQSSPPKATYHTYRQFSCMV